MSLLRQRTMSHGGGGGGVEEGVLLRAEPAATTKDGDPHLDEHEHHACVRAALECMPRCSLVSPLRARARRATAAGI